MKITFDPPDLPEQIDPALRDLIRDNAVLLADARCETHNAAPVEVRITPGTEGNVVDIEVIGCCDEYAIEEE